MPQTNVTGPLGFLSSPTTKYCLGLKLTGRTQMSFTYAKQKVENKLIAKTDANTPAYKPAAMLCRNTAHNQQRAAPLLTDNDACGRER